MKLGVITYDKHPYGKGLTAMVVGEPTSLVFKLVKALFLGAESTVLYGKRTSYDSEVMSHNL